MKVYAKVPTANGVYASVQFVNGVGETENPHLLDWFHKHGYTLECEICDEIHTENENPENVLTDALENADAQIEEIEMMGYADNTSKEEHEEVDFSKMSVNEIRDWAKSKGLGHLIKNIKNRERLLSLLGYVESTVEEIKESEEDN